MYVSFRRLVRIVEADDLRTLFSICAGHVKHAGTPARNPELVAHGQAANGEFHIAGTPSVVLDTPFLRR